MVPEKPLIRLCHLFWHLNVLSFERDEILLQHWLREVAPQAFAQNNSEIVIEGDQARIECGIMKAAKAKTVAWVEPILGKIAPWFDVTRNQETRNMDSRYAAAHAVCVQNSLAEELLTASDADGRPCFSWSRWRYKAAGLKFHAIALQEIDFFVFIFCE
jgi:hypothetical protein